MSEVLFFVGQLLHSRFFDRYDSYDPKRGYVGKYVTDLHTLWQVVETRGQYVKVSQPGNRRSHWYNSKRFTPVANDRMGWAIQRITAGAKAQAEQEVADALAKAERDTAALSRNTVTRALIHAHDNGYCNETVVALVSAGHKMPKGTVTVEVKLNVELEVDGAKADGYYMLRQMFGTTRGNLQELNGQAIYADQIHGMLRSKLALAGIEWGYGNVTLTRSNIQFPAPTIRPLADVMSAPPATRSDEDFDPDED